MNVASTSKRPSKGKWIRIHERIQSQVLNLPALVNVMHMSIMSFSFIP